MAELAGTWTLRTFNPTFVTGNETPQEDAFIAGTLDLRLDRAADPLYAAGMAADPFYLVGTIGWPGNPPGVLDVKGRIDTRPGVEHQRFDLTDTGRPQTPTAGWQYDYYGHMGRNWAKPPDASRIDRHPTLVGSVIRVKPHSGSRAGEVLSFIAVKPQQADMPHSYDVTGEWTYRSFRNDAQGPPPRPNGLILQEAVLKLETKLETVPERRSPVPPHAITDPSYTKTTLRGTIEWSGRVLDINGEVDPSPLEIDQPPVFRFSATGRGGTASAGWQYEYHGDMTRAWTKPPDADRIDQVPALVGTVIRQKAHGDSPAGIVYPFIAVKQ